MSLFRYVSLAFIIKFKSEFILFSIEITARFRFFKQPTFSPLKAAEAKVATQKVWKKIPKFQKIKMDFHLCQSENLEISNEISLMTHNYISRLFQGQIQNAGSTCYVVFMYLT